MASTPSSQPKFEESTALYPTTQTQLSDSGTSQPTITHRAVRPARQYRNHHHPRQQPYTVPGPSSASVYNNTGAGSFDTTSSGQRLGHARHLLPRHSSTGVSIAPSIQFAQQPAALSDPFSLLTPSPMTNAPFPEQSDSATQYLQGPCVTPSSAQATAMNAYNTNNQLSMQQEYSQPFGTQAHFSNVSFGTVNPQNVEWNLPYGVSTAPTLPTTVPGSYGSSMPPPARTSRQGPMAHPYRSTQRTPNTSKVPSFDEPRKALNDQIDNLMATLHSSPGFDCNSTTPTGPTVATSEESLTEEERTRRFHQEIMRRTKNPNGTWETRNDPPAVHASFKARHPTRDRIEKDEHGSVSTQNEDGGEGETEPMASGALEMLKEKHLASERARVSDTVGTNVGPVVDHWAELLNQRMPTLEDFRRLRERRGK